jgi:hypothetical protein
MRISSKLKRPANIAAMAILAVCTTGCGGCGTSPTTVVGTAPAEQHIAQIVSVWIDYNRVHHKPAPNIEALKNHLKTTMKSEQLERMNIKDQEAVFVSPRDQQKYVLLVPRSPLGGVILYEKNGVNGKHMTATSTGGINELDKKELEAAAGEPLK